MKLLQTLYTAASALCIANAVLAADTFASITPELSSPTPAYTSTSFPYAATNTTAAVNIDDPNTTAIASMTTQEKAVCTYGVFREACRSAASTARPDLGSRSLLWGSAVGAVALCFGRGRVGLLLILMLLAAVHAQAQTTCSGSSEAMAMSTTTTTRTTILTKLVTAKLPLDAGLHDLGVAATAQSATTTEPFLPPQLASTFFNTGSGMLTASANSAMPSYTASTTNTAVQKVDSGCTMVGDLESCPLPESGTPASSAAPVSLYRTSGIFSIVAACIVSARIERRAALFAVAMFLSADQIRQVHALGTTTSILLPQLAVNTSTYASTTATETVYVTGSVIEATPTVTLYIAACTPYCSEIDNEGHCVDVKGCSNAVMRNSGVGKYQAAMASLGVAFLMYVGVTAVTQTWRLFSSPGKQARRPDVSPIRRTAVW